MADIKVNERGVDKVHHIRKNFEAREEECMDKWQRDAN